MRKRKEAATRELSPDETVRVFAGVEAALVELTESCRTAYACNLALIDRLTGFNAA